MPMQKIVNQCQDISNKGIRDCHLQTFGTQQEKQCLEQIQLVLL